MSEGLVAFVLLALVGLLIAERAGFASGGGERPKAAFVLKPMASFGFLALALVREWPSTETRQLVVLGLALSVLGDVCLLGRAKRWLLAGLGLFLLAHLAYASAFWVRGVDRSVLIAGLIVLAIPAALVWRALRPHLAASMKVAVPAYVVVITAMLALAMATRLVWLSGPALLFYLSDLFVARERFLRSGFVNRLVGLPLYYAAQLLFAWG